MANQAVGGAGKPQPQFDPALVPGVIGAELARHTSAVDEVLQAFRRNHAISRSQMSTLKNATAAMQRIGVYSQQISRLAGGHLRQSHERLSLDELTRRVVADNDWRHYQDGLVIEQHLQPVEVIVDPGLLVSLLEVAIDCAARHGQALGLWLSVRNWPEHGLLTIQSRPHIATAEVGTADRDESLEWVMLLHLAQAMGVMVDREFLGDHVVLTLEFTRTVKKLEGLTAIEIDMGGDSGVGGESQSLAGHRLLLVTGDERLRGAVREVCTSMRLVLDTSPTVRQAIRYCELDKPDIILVDERLHDAQFDQLREDLLRHDVNFPCVEIATAPNVVEVASWTGERMSRISRDAVPKQLSSMLAMELAKVF